MIRDQYRARFRLHWPSNLPDPCKGSNRRSFDWRVFLGSMVARWMAHCLGFPGHHSISVRVELGAELGADVPVYGLRVLPYKADARPVRFRTRLVLRLARRASDCLSFWLRGVRGSNRLVDRLFRRYGENCGAGNGTPSLQP